MFKSYEDAYRRSLEDREGFWSIAAGAIHWEKKWDKVLDDSKAPFYQWFVGGKMNTCYNAIDIHVENGRKDQTAIIYDSPVTDTKQKITYGELLNKVADFAGALKSLGVEKGDRVVIYMPMIPEAAVAMFACARIGAIHSLVFGGFASNELAVRIEDAKPKIVLKGHKVKGQFRGPVRVKVIGKPDGKLPDGTAGVGLNPKSVPKTRKVTRKGKTVIKIRTRDKLGNQSPVAKVVIRIRR